jgi:uncharacterized protein (TIGR00369 family)
MQDLDEERARFLAQDFRQGFIDFCQFKVEAIKAGFLQSSLDVAPCHQQQDGFVHAGVMATMADHTAGYACFTLLDPGLQVLTIEFKINFLSPAQGPRLVCRGEVLKSGKKLFVAESRVYDGEPDSGGVLAAKAMLTLMPVPREALRKGKAGAAR